MKRPHRNDDGTYHIQGKKYKELFGSRHQVWNKTAYKTTGNLTRKHLLMNKWGRIVSNKKHFTAKREKRLEKYGYYAKKGKFGYVIKMNTKKQKNRKLRRGGNGNIIADTLIEGTKNATDTLIEGTKNATDTLSEGTKNVTDALSEGTKNVTDALGKATETGTNAEN